MVINCQWNGDNCFSVLSITSATQPNEAVSFVGKPANYISSETYSVQILNSAINYIPPAFFSVFPNLKMFTLDNYQKLTLAANPNLSCGHLKQFTVSNGLVSNIPEGFLQTCSQITDLYLRDNRIEMIDKNAFKGLEKLAILELINNNLTCLPADLFQNLPLLSTILLRNNKIKIINSGTFRNLPVLSYVNLEENLLRYLPTFDFNGTATKAISTFLINYNPIYAISPDFTSIYTKRGALPDIIFNFANFPCFSDNNQYSLCLTTLADSGPYLQKCYQNWTSSMTDNALCGQSSVPVTTAAPLCPIASFWQQLLEYLKSVKLT